ncbi:hypothetical protein EUGRSUZ_H00911 [Eucalyptus grandis]|uniref:Uncharacterized protein n=2 Tax=Eucalyptus grandis TaxID=71139 RepID=A0ACC3KD92_EUCGR|nr:hypothetical protein EUGRSUZ_H00911 [Eucalyptus grandis]
MNPSIISPQDQINLPFSTHPVHQHCRRSSSVLHSLPIQIYTYPLQQQKINIFLQPLCVLRAVKLHQLGC